MGPILGWGWGQERLAKNRTLELRSGWLCKDWGKSFPCGRTNKGWVGESTDAERSQPGCGKPGRTARNEAAEEGGDSSQGTLQARSPLLSLAFNFNLRELGSHLKSFQQGPCLRHDSPLAFWLLRGKWMVEKVIWGWPIKRLPTVPTGDEGGSGKDGNRADRSEWTWDMLSSGGQISRSSILR